MMEYRSVTFIHCSGQVDPGNYAGSDPCASGAGIVSAQPIEWLSRAAQLIQPAVKA
jgi:hypothetical protein